MKENTHCIALAIAFVLSVLFALFVPLVEEYQYIQENTLRLHILANSNSTEDQDLKLQLRDDLLEAYGTTLGNEEDFFAAEDLVADNLPEITDFLQQKIYDYGYTYTLSAYLTQMEFPQRIYSDTVALPSGYYHALRITIGQGEGENWWCVLYPPMCIPTIEEDTKEGQRIVALSDGTILKPKLATMTLWDSLSDKFIDYFGK